MKFSSSAELRTWLEKNHELEKQTPTREFFYSINDSSKRFVPRWLKLAKTEKTRNARILELAELSAKREKMKGS